jgi:hypothetical protein
MSEPTTPSAPGGALDDLLAPSLGERTAPSAQRPWRVGSQVWIGLLGGPLPVALIAWLNGGRLGVDSRRRGWILGWGVLGLVATLVAAWFIGGAHDGDLRAARSFLRLSSRAAGLLAYLAVARLQGAADRAYRMFDERGYASLWGPGATALFGLGIPQALLIALVAWMAGR